MTARTVLLVDDSRVARMITGAAIAKTHPNWTIIEASSGEEGLKLAAATPPNFILVDVNMPGMDGLTTATRLKALCPGAAISLLTANIQEATRHHAQEIGVGFLNKPVSEELLLTFLVDRP